MIRRLICRLTGGHEWGYVVQKMHLTPRTICIKCGKEYWA